MTCSSSHPTQWAFSEDDLDELQRASGLPWNEWKQWKLWDEASQTSPAETLQVEYKLRFYQNTVKAKKALVKDVLALANSCLEYKFQRSYLVFGVPTDKEFKGKASSSRLRWGSFDEDLRAIRRNFGDNMGFEFSQLLRSHASHTVNFKYYELFCASGLRFPVVAISPVFERAKLCPLYANLSFPIRVFDKHNEIAIENRNCEASEDALLHLQQTTQPGGKQIVLWNMCLEATVDLISRVDHVVDFSSNTSRPSYHSQFSIFSNEDTLPHYLSGEEKYWVFVRVSDESQEFGALITSKFMEAIRLLFSDCLFVLNVPPRPSPVQQVLTAAFFQAITADWSSIVVKVRGEWKMFPLADFSKWALRQLPIPSLYISLLHGKLELESSDVASLGRFATVHPPSARQISFRSPTAYLRGAPPLWSDVPNFFQSAAMTKLRDDFFELVRSFRNSTEPVTHVQLHHMPGTGGSSASLFLLSAVQFSVILLLQQRNNPKFDHFFWGECLRVSLKYQQLLVLLVDAPFERKH